MATMRQNFRTRLVNIFQELADSADTDTNERVMRRWEELEAADKISKILERLEAVEVDKSPGDYEIITRAVT